MVKYCEICNIEISDTDYDSNMRYIRVKYCPECAKKVRKQQKRESIRRRRAKEKALATYDKEQKLLNAAEETKYLRERAKEIRNQRVYIRDVSVPELELRRECRQLKQQLQACQERNDKLTHENWRIKVDSAKMQEQLQGIQRFLESKMQIK